MRSICVDAQQEPRERPRERMLSRRFLMIFALIFYLGLIGFFVFWGYSIEWTGFGPARVPKGVQPAKTLWDWLALLLPGYTAVIVTYFGTTLTRQQSDIQREVEERRARETAVLTYVDQTLILLANEAPRDSQSREELRVLLRARTRMVLDRIGATDKKGIVRFLHDAGLLLGEKPAVILNGADLSGVILSGVGLREANLSGANMREAELNGADLRHANLS